MYVLVDIQLFITVTKPSADLLTPRAGLLTVSCDEGKFSVICRVPSKQNRQLMLKILELTDSFQVRVFFFFSFSFYGHTCGIYSQARG